MSTCQAVASYQKGILPTLKSEDYIWQFITNLFFSQSFAYFKGGMTRSLLDSSIEMGFWYKIKAPICLITPVKYDMQQMLILKVTSKNVAKVQKWLML